MLTECTRRRQLDASQPPAFCGVYDFGASRFDAFFSCVSEEFLDAVRELPYQLCPLASDSAWARCAYNHAVEAFRRHQARIRVHFVTCVFTACLA